MTKTSAKSTGAQKATADKTIKAAQETVEKVVNETTKNLDSVTEFNKANYDAFVAASNVAVKVAQDVNAELLENSKKAVEKNVEDFKSLFSAKTPAEFFELQTNMMKSRYDEFVAESTRVNEVVKTNATEISAPLKARYEEVAEKYNLPLAG